MTVTKFETANFFVTSFFDPVFDAESHGGLHFGSFCCFEVDIFGKSMVLRAHPVIGRARTASLLVSRPTTTTAHVPIGQPTTTTTAPNG